MIRRRLTSISGLVAVTVVLVVLLPLLIVVSTAVDLVVARRRMPTLRALGFALGYCAMELLGLARATFVFLVELGGRRGEDRWIEANRRIQAWLFGLLATLARPTLGLTIELDGETAIADGPMLVFGRHVSLVDSLVSAFLLGTERGFELRVVLKRELQFDPCLDILGHRLRNHFVERSGGDAGEIEAVGRLARDLDDRVAVVVFPEGTRFNPAKQAQAVERLRARDDAVDLVPRAELLRHLLPPRPGGALALLAEAPTTDVVVLGHVGFEGLDDFAGLWQRIPFRVPVRVRAERFERSTVPDDPHEQVRWLFDRWVELDRWIDAELAGRA